MLTRAVRLDLVHAGTPGTERYEVVGASGDTHPDAFVPRALDARGDYRWSVLSAAGVPLASRGYATLFDEWQSTVVGCGEATCAQFKESHVVPWFPGATVRFEKRTRGDAYRTLLEHPLPAAEPPPAAGREDARQLRQLHGDPGMPVFLLVSEGYATSDADAFFDVAQRAAGILLAAEPYRAYAGSIAVSALFVPSPASGVPAVPEGGSDLGNFSTSYGVFGMDRYLVAMDLHRLREATRGIASTTLIVLANAPHYGGSGIFNSNCCVAAGMRDEDLAYVLLHELGHSFGGLADEYFGSSVPYATDLLSGSSRWEPNVSAIDAAGRVKWSARVTPGTPVPTPWRHADYLALSAPADLPDDTEAAVRLEAALQRRARLSTILAQEPYAGAIGAFEGACYQAHGMFRPEVDCRMFSRTAQSYCTVCREALVEAMHRVLPP